MRVAIIADIHGNFVALDSVLAELDRDPVDRVVCLGDVAFGGPQPRECLARLRDLGCPVVQGNTDAMLLAPPAGEAPVAETGRWNSAQLTRADRAYLATFAPRVGVPLPGGAQLLCYHGSPHSYDDPILATTPDDALARYLAGYEAAIYAGGHTHLQLYRRFATSLVVNPGSVGMAPAQAPPAGPARRGAWAEYAILTITELPNRSVVELHRTPYDLGGLAASVTAAAMPQADWYLDAWR